MRKTQFTLAPLALAAFLAVSVGNMAHAQTAPVVSVSIAAQPLGQALNELARQANLQLSFPAALVTGKTAPAVSGNLTARQALDRLLAGSGLAADIKGSEVTVRSAPPTPAAGQETTLAPVTVTAQAERDATSEGTGSYAARGSTLYKGAESLKEIPQSVSVVTRQQMDDQGITDLRQAVEHAPGIFTVSGYASDTAARSSSADFYSRGFQVQSYMLDGIAGSAMDAGNAGVNAGLSGNSAIYDRVEILRGASGLLIGSGSPGGTVNLVRKRPTADFQQRYTLSTGSWSSHYAEADLSGPLNTAGSLRGRVVAAYEDKDYFWEVTHSKSPLLFGIVEADISSATNVSLGARYEKYKETGGRQGTFTLMDYSPPRSHNPAPYWGYRDTIEKEVFLDLKHQFNDRWRLAVAATHRNIDSERVLPRTFADDSTAMLQVVGGKTNATGLDSSLTGAFDAFGREHKLTFGFNISRQEYDGYLENCRSWTGCLTYQHSYLNFDPHTSWPLGNIERTFIDQALSGPRTHRRTTSQGVFGKLDFKLTDNLTAILGGRMSGHEYKYYDADGVLQPTEGGKVKGEFTPFTGLIYALSPQWSAYASYADIFKPQWGSYTRSGRLIEHEIGKNYELGVKGELLGGRLNTAFAIYQVDLKNTAIADDPPYDTACAGNPTGGSCFVDSGHRRTRGFDAEVSGEVLRNWQISAGYTYTQTKNIKSDRDEGQGVNVNEGYQVPRHMFKLWSSYRLSGALAGLTLGGGATVQSKSINNNYPGFSDGGRAVWDAFARYEINRNWNLSLNVKNVFDKVYWPNGTSYFKSIYGEPRSYKLTLQAKF